MGGGNFANVEHTRMWTTRCGIVISSRGIYYQLVRGVEHIIYRFIPARAIVYIGIIPREYIKYYIYMVSVYGDKTIGNPSNFSYTLIVGHRLIKGCRDQKIENLALQTDLNLEWDISMKWRAPRPMAVSLIQFIAHMYFFESFRMLCRHEDCDIEYKNTRM